VTDVIEATEVVVVQFAGEGSGSDGLTWGQQHIWNAMRELGSPMNMCATRELAAGASVAEFADELRYYLSRFQSMRSRLELVPGDWPRQVVVESGEAAIEIIDVPPEQDPAELAARLTAVFEEAEFDYEREFPIRMTLLRRDGALTHMVLTISHFATDAVGAMAMYNDYVHRDACAGGDAKPPALAPLDLAAQQRQPGALRQSEASLRYWENLLRTIPMHRFPEPVDPGPGRYCQVRMDSPAMLLALRALGMRLGVDVSTALLGVVAVGIARVAGINPVVAQMVVSNRFRPGFAQIVSNVAQAGLFVVDVADITVDEAVARSRRASINAYKYAYFDFARWKELVAQVNRDRGGVVDLRCYYNDRPLRPVEDADRAPSREEIEAALPSTSALRWSDLPFFNEHLMVTIDDVPGAIGLIVLADTAYFPRARMEVLARELESLAVTVAHEPNVPVALESSQFQWESR
jgi:hypothetical protein